MTAAERQKKYCLAHPGRVKEARLRYCLLHPEKRKESKLKWSKANPEKGNEATRRWRAANPEKAKECHKRWRTKHSDKYKAKQKRAFENRMSTIKGKLNHSIKNNILHSLKNNSKCGRHWEMLVNYTVKDLKKHLEQQFRDGMTWGNYGLYGWHIDHIIPISVFNFEKPEDDDFKRCWALKNLQPLWAIDNIIKSNNLNRHFQPNLIF